MRGYSLRGLTDTELKRLNDLKERIRGLKESRGEWFSSYETSSQDEMDLAWILSLIEPRTE